MNLGFIFVAVGFIFLMLSFILYSSAVLWWGISLGINIISNIAGTTILICLVISSIIGESITGAIFLIQNIYDVIVGKEFHFSMRSFIIMFSIVFISGFNFINL